MYRICMVRKVWLCVCHACCTHTIVYAQKTKYTLSIRVYIVFAFVFSSLRSAREMGCVIKSDPSN